MRSGKFTEISFLDNRKKWRARPSTGKASCKSLLVLKYIRKMENSTTSNGPTVFSTEDSDENEVYFKQRCKFLETQLEKFREQAAKVREVISQKVCM